MCPRMFASMFHSTCRLPRGPRLITIPLCVEIQRPFFFCPVAIVRGRRWPFKTKSKQTWITLKNLSPTAHRCRGQIYYTTCDSVNCRVAAQRPWCLSGPVQPVPKIEKYVTKKKERVQKSRALCFLGQEHFSLLEAAGVQKHSRKRTGLNWFWTYQSNIWVIRVFVPCLSDWLLTVQPAGRLRSLGQHSGDRWMISLDQFG